MTEKIRTCYSKHIPPADPRYAFAGSEYQMPASSTSRANAKIAMRNQWFFMGLSLPKRKVEIQEKEAANACGSKKDRTYSYFQEPFKHYAILITRKL